ncbi:glyoxalase [Rhodococcus sp. NPDC054953]
MPRTPELPAADTVTPNEATVPLLPCLSVDDTLAFYRALGFEVTYEMTRPYLYLALSFSGFEVHFGTAPEGLDPTRETSGGCLVLVDAVAPYHRAFSSSLRTALGRVPGRGLPRITRFREGQSRFTVVDPSGNSLIFIQRDEPDVEYGGSSGLNGLARAVDNARIFREFKNDDATAARVLDVALRRFGEAADDATLLGALTARAEVAIALDDPATADELAGRIRALRAQ